MSPAPNDPLILFQGAMEGKLDAVRAALHRGIPVNAIDPRRGTPLHAAIKGGNVEVVAMLIARGADVDRLHAGRSPLSFACSFRFLRSLYPEDVPRFATAYERIVAALIAAGADLTRNQAQTCFLPLRAALSHGTRPMVDALLAAGAPLEAEWLAEALDARDFDTFSLLLERIADAPLDALLLRLAAQAERHAGAAALGRELIARGASIDHADASGATAAHYCAYWANEALLAVLVEAGADLDRPTTRSWSPGDHARPPGVTACQLLGDSLRAQLAGLAGDASAAALRARGRADVPAR